jgi:DNA polymerase III epsilon subunit-like protein
MPNGCVPAASKVMRELARFVGEHPLAAHNAAFDSKFWDAELTRVQQTRRQAFVCTMRVARRRGRRGIAGAPALAFARTRRNSDRPRPAAFARAQSSRKN